MFRCKLPRSKMLPRLSFPRTQAYLVVPQQQQKQSRGPGLAGLPSPQDAVASLTQLQNQVRLRLGGGALNFAYLNAWLRLFHLHRVDVPRVGSG